MCCINSQLTDLLTCLLTDLLLSTDHTQVPMVDMRRQWYLSWSQTIVRTSETVITDTKHLVQSAIRQHSLVSSWQITVIQSEFTSSNKQKQQCSWLVTLTHCWLPCSNIVTVINWVITKIYGKQRKWQLTRSGQASSLVNQTGGRTTWLGHLPQPTHHIRYTQDTLHQQQCRCHWSLQDISTIQAWLRHIWNIVQDCDDLYQLHQLTLTIKETVSKVLVWQTSSVNSFNQKIRTTYLYWQHLTVSRNVTTHLLT